MMGWTDDHREQSFAGFRRFVATFAWIATAISKSTHQNRYEKRARPGLMLLLLKHQVLAPKTIVTVDIETMQQHSRDWHRKLFTIKPGGITIKEKKHTLVSARAKEPSAFPDRLALLYDFL